MVSPPFRLTTFLTEFDCMYATRSALDLGKEMKVRIK